MQDYQGGRSAGPQGRIEPRRAGPGGSHIAHMSAGLSKCTDSWTRDRSVKVRETSPPRPIGCSDQHEKLEDHNYDDQVVDGGRRRRAHCELTDLRPGQSQPEIPQRGDRGESGGSPDGSTGAEEWTEGRRALLRANAAEGSFGCQPEGHGCGQSNGHVAANRAKQQAEGDVRQDVEAV